MYQNMVSLNDNKAIEVQLNQPISPKSHDANVANTNVTTQVQSLQSRFTAEN